MAQETQGGVATSHLKYIHTDNISPGSAQFTNSNLCKVQGQQFFCTVLLVMRPATPLQARSGRGMGLLDPPHPSLHDDLGKLVKQVHKE